MGVAALRHPVDQRWAVLFVLPHPAAAAAALPDGPLLGRVAGAAVDTLSRGGGALA